MHCSLDVAPGGYSPEIQVNDSQIQSWSFGFFGSSNATVTNSTLEYLAAEGSSVAMVTNSTCSSYLIDWEGEVYVHWYLDVHVVDSIGQHVPSANVTATYPNATVTQSKLTNTDGKAKLTLMEKMLNDTGEYPVGNYTVEATYDTYSDHTTVNMTENRQITLTLQDFIIPEFPSLLLFLPLSIITTLIAVIVWTRKHAA